MYRKILAPIDGSPTSERGLLEATRLAKIMGASLRLVHIVEEFSGYPGMGGSIYDVDGILDVLRANGEKIVERALAFASEQGVKAESVIYDDFAYRTSDLIVDEAKESQADLIVMGTHGRRGVSRLVLGSDAEIVVRNSPVPVLLVRYSEKKTRAKAQTKKGK